MMKRHYFIPGDPVPPGTCLACGQPPSGDLHFPPTTQRSSILAAAEIAVTHDRAAVYGSAEDNFASIAGHWNWWLGARLREPLTAYDVAQMMVGVKQARARTNPSHLDNFVDACGYSALAGEIGAKKVVDVDLG